MMPEPCGKPSPAHPRSLLMPRAVAYLALAAAFVCVLIPPATVGTGPEDAPSTLPPVLVPDFQKAARPPNVWVVRSPQENAAVQLSTDQPHEGKQCLKLHYRFVAGENFQHIGIANKTRIQAPVHKLRFLLFGDKSKCSYGVRIND